MEEEEEKDVDEEKGDKKEDKKKLKAELAQTRAEDEKILSADEITKPKPVAKFNPTLTLEKLRINAEKMRRKPGMHLIFLYVFYTLKMKILI